MAGGSSSRTLRHLASEAGLTLGEARERLRRADQDVPHVRQPLEGKILRRIRAILGLSARSPGVRTGDESFTAEELDRRILCPLLRKGKVGRTHTTPIENLYGRGVPDDQKSRAKARVEELLRSGLLAEKVSQGRRHFYLTKEGRAAAKALGPPDEGP